MSTIRKNLQITEDIIPLGVGIRDTKQKIISNMGLVVHWIGVAQPSATVIRRNFGQNQYGTHYIIDWNDGGIIHCVPDDESCWHVGASSYPAWVEKTFDKKPNSYLIGIECCISPIPSPLPNDWNDKNKHPNMGKPSEIQYEKLVDFCAWWLLKNNFTVDNLYRHYDITGKQCPIWFSNWSDEWINFKDRVSARMRL